MRYLFFILWGYLSGSVLYAWLLPKWLCGKDIRKESPDQNPGTANAFTQGGIAVGIPVLFLELAKGFLPVYIAARCLDIHRPLFALVLAAPVAGHAFPAGNVKNGGKAIAVSFGCLLGLWPEWRPVALLVGLYLLFSLVVVIRPHSRRSIVTFLSLIAGSISLVKNKAVVLGIMLLSGIVVEKHLAARNPEKAKSSVKVF